MVTLGSIVTLLWFLCLFGPFYSSFGYVDIELQRIEQLSGKDFADWSQLKVRRINKDRKLIGNITVHTDLVNSYMLDAQVYKKQGGEYRLLPFRVPKRSFCDLVRDDVYFYPDLAAVSDFEMPAPCPHKKGIYEFRGYSPTLENVPTAITPTGEYAVEARVWNNSEMVFKTRMYAAVINL